KPCIRKQLFKCFGVPEAVPLIHDRSQVTFRDPAQATQERDLVVGTPGGNCQSAAFCQRQTHLRGCRRLVGKELQSLLTGDDVELLFLAKRQGGGGSFTPIDARLDGACHGEHIRTYVDADDISLPAEPLPSHTGQYSGSASDVEEPL